MYRKYNTDFLSKCSENYSKFNKKLKKKKPNFSKCIENTRNFSQCIRNIQSFNYNTKVSKNIKTFYERRNIFSEKNQKYSQNK